MGFFCRFVSPPPLNLYSSEAEDAAPQPPRRNAHVGGRRGAGISTHAPPAPGWSFPWRGGDDGHPGLLLLPPPVPLTASPRSPPPPPAPPAPSWPPPADRARRGPAPPPHSPAPHGWGVCGGGWPVSPGAGAAPGCGAAPPGVERPPVAAALPQPLLLLPPPPPPDTERDPATPTAGEGGANAPRLRAALPPPRGAGMRPQRGVRGARNVGGGRGEGGGPRGCWAAKSGQSAAEN